MSTVNLFNRIRHSAAGNVLMIAAASMPLVIGSGGLAVDTVQWVVWKRQLQRQADSASLAGAFAITQSKSAMESATADLSRTSEITLSAPPVIENPPSSGAYAGNNKAVRVALQTSRTLPFSGMFMSAAPIISAQGTAAVLTNGNYCMLALDTSTKVGITMQGNATLNLGCGMATNSAGNNAVVAGGSSSIIATPIVAVGGLASSSNYTSPTTLLPYSAPQVDPFASLPDPSVSGCSGKVNVQPNTSQTLSPGCYKGMDLKGTVTLQPGTYYIDGSSFGVGSQATIIGTGVTIVLTSSNASSNPGSIATVSINGGANIQLSAPTSGTYKGVLLYQDRRAPDSGSNTINGNASSFLQGAIYIPSQVATFNGTAGMKTDCLQLVAKRLVFTGNSTISNQCPSDSGANSFVGTRVKLVG